MHRIALVSSIVAAFMALAACQTAPEVGGEPAATAPPDQFRTYWPPLRIAAPTRALDRERKDPPRPVETLPPDAGHFRKCAACHSLTTYANGLGPSLRGVYGQPAASNPAFGYSTALREADLVWDAATLDTFLTRPSDHVPGTKMSFAGLKDPASRAQIIALMERYRD